MLYNLSEFITTVKENVLIDDLPIPITDQKIIERFDRVTLTDFSVCYPRVETFMLGNDNIDDKSKYSTGHSYYTYTIPKWVYDGTKILDIADLRPIRPNGYSDFFIPISNWASPEAVIGAVGDIRMAASIASSMSKSPTIKFDAPNTIKVYNGYAGGVYEVEALLKHDLSLATVPDGAITNLRNLAELDLKWFLYNKLKRKDGLELGIGNSQLNISDWASAEQERKDLIKEWMGESNIDFDHIQRY